MQNVYSTSAGWLGSGSWVTSPESSISSTKLDGNMPYRPSGLRPFHQPSSNASISVIMSPGSKVISSSFSEKK